MVGGQFGSEAKGATVGWLAAQYRARGRPVAIVRVAGPNAGHTAYDPQGRAWALRQVPVGGVLNPDAALIIAAGSEIDEEVLQSEIAALEAGGIPVIDRLFIDGSATAITPSDRARESGLNARIGSTAKGIGAARAGRIMREAPLWSNGTEKGIDTAAWLRRWLRDGNDVIIEGTQGYGLGLHAGWYPYSTSSDCRAIDFLAMAGISPWQPGVSRVEPWVVLRTHPIRVAGNSGPLEGETTWEEMAERTGGHVQPERTTVTKRIRRVGAWDPELARAAVCANGGPTCRVVLTMLDYWFPELAGVADPADLSAAAHRAIKDVSTEVGAPVALVGTGPQTQAQLEEIW